MIERIMTKRLGAFNVQPSWIIILYSVLEWGHACWLSEDREPRILFYNYLICFYIITHLFHIQSGDYEWLFSKASKALSSEGVCQWKYKKKRSWKMKLGSSEESGAITITVTSQNSLNTWRRFHPLSRTSSTGWGDRRSSWRSTFWIRTRKVNFISIYQSSNQSLMWRATPGRAMFPYNHEESVNEAEERGALP